jgi:thiol-disulfide isomerase/thioredoxin
MKFSKEKIKHFIKDFIIMLLVMTVVANVMSIYRSQSLNNTPLNIKEFRLIDNTTYHIDTTKPLLIHFWATWCPTCKLEASNINFLSKYYQVITIAVKSGSDYEIKKYLDKHGYRFKVVNDKNGSLSRRFKIAGFPTTFIYDSRQKLRFAEVGYTSTLGLWIRLLWSSLGPKSS